MKKLADEIEEQTQELELAKAELQKLSKDLERSLEQLRFLETKISELEDAIAVKERSKEEANRVKECIILHQYYDTLNYETE